MKTLTVIISLLLIAGLMAGCQKQPDTAMQEQQQGTGTQPQDTQDADITQELDSTVVDDSDLEVGEML